MVLTCRKAQTETMTAPLQHGAGAPQPPYASTASGMVVNGLTKLYQRGGNTVQALAGVSLSIPQGSQLAIMGPSGCGKTTLLHCLAGVLRPTTGSITLDGTEITQLSEGAISELRLKHFGFVFQDGQLLPELPSQENIAMPLMLADPGESGAGGRRSIPPRPALRWSGAARCDWARADYQSQSCLCR